MSIGLPYRWLPLKNQTQSFPSNSRFFLPIPTSRKTKTMNCRNNSKRWTFCKSSIINIKKRKNHKKIRIGFRREIPSKMMFTLKTEMVVWPTPIALHHRNRCHGQAEIIVFRIREGLRHRHPADRTIRCPNDRRRCLGQWLVHARRPRTRCASFSMQFSFVTHVWFFFVAVMYCVGLLFSLLRWVVDLR